MRTRNIAFLVAVPAFLALGACAEEEEPEPIVEEPVTEIQPTTAPQPEPVAQGPLTSVAEIMESPLTYTGQTFMGEVRVAEVVSDRGFWVEDQGERIFVVIMPEGGERPDIQAGQSVRLREATVRDPTFLTNLGELEPETRNTLEGLPVFMTVDPGNINQLGQ